MNNFRNIAQYLLDLNLFHTVKSNETTLDDERLSTRFYIVSFILGIVTIFFYMLFATQMTLFTINWPSQFDYEQLVADADIKNTINCPCSHIAVEYRSFVTMKVSSHQICSSDFVSESWIKRTYPTNLSYLYPMDTRRSISAHAQLLRSFCSFVQMIVSDSMAKFGSSSFISARLMSESLLRIQVNSSLDFIRSTSSISSLILPLQAIRRTTFGNQLVSGLGTNFYAKSQYLGSINQGTMVDNAYIDFNTTRQCYCRDWTSQCLLAGALYEWEVPILVTDLSYLTNFSYVLGMKAGCLPMESLLRSTLECYFEETCIRLLLRISNTSHLLFSPLNKTTPSRFDRSSTVEELLNSLFIETWNTIINYMKFFNECQPTHCTYMAMSFKYSRFYIFNTMLGFIGGLLISLRLIIPFILRAFRKLSELFDRIRQSIHRNNDHHNKTNNSVINSTHQTTVSNRFRTWVSWLWLKLITFNLFNEAPHHQSVQHHGRFVTYIYIVSLSLSLIILVIYNTIPEQTQTSTIFHPNLKTFEQFEQLYGDSLECPCANIAITHHYFIDFDIVHHPICTSELVSPDFYEIFTRFSWIVSPLEFNSVSTWYFQLLNTFCSLTNSTLINAQKVFDTTQWIATLVPSRRVFDNRSQIITSYYMNNTRDQFINTLDILRAITSGSQLMSVYQSSFIITIINKLALVRFDSRLFLGFENNTTTTCSCIHDSICSTQAGQFEYHYPSIIPLSRIWTAPGIKVSCTPIDSLLQSTLECWYDFNCLEQVQTYFDNDDDPISLNITPINLSIRFQASTTIEEIIRHLMLDQWQASISYDNFFTQCAPLSCTYTYTSRNNIFYVVSCVIALFGGLNMALYILIPLTVRMIAKITSRNEVGETDHAIINIQHRFIGVIQRIYQSLLGVNLFANRSSNILTMTHERILTRLYLFCHFSTTFILLIYMCLIYQTKSITMKSPRQSIYEQLLINYPDTLIQCPCLRVAIPYQTFLTIEFYLHPICTSDFVSSSWLDLTFGSGNWSLLDSRDFRIRGFAYFTQLASLCSSARQILLNEVKSFSQNQFISTQLISRQKFEAQLQTTLNDFRVSMAITFSRTLELFRNTIQGNQLISIYTTNWIFTPGSTIWVPLNTKPLSHGVNCSCATSNECIQSAAIYSLNTTIFNIPGFVLACLPIESLLRSTLECFYHQTCVDRLMIYMKNTSNNNTNFTALDSTMSSDFWPSMTVNELASQLFIENTSWKTNISYAAFYSQCEPTLCTYTIIERNDILFIFTSIVGLYGGLIRTFRYLIPATGAIVKIISLKIRGTRVTSITPQIAIIDRTINTEMK